MSNLLFVASKNYQQEECSFHAADTLTQMQLWRTACFERKGNDMNFKKILRVRLILFRSYLADGIYSMTPTDFYTLPIQSESFTMIVRSIRAAGGHKTDNEYNGGREPNDALESIAYALKSNWADNLPENHRIVIVMTDNRAQPIGFNMASTYYPTGMPGNLEELEKQWNHETESGLKHRKQQMILMTPDVYPWTRIKEEWKHVIFHECTLQQGLKELDYSDIIKEIATAVLK